MGNRLSRGYYDHLFQDDVAGIRALYGQRSEAPALADLGGVPGKKGALENPPPNGASIGGTYSSQSGTGVVSGWVCEANEVLVDLSITAEWRNDNFRYQADFGSDYIPRVAGYGMERRDTLAACGDVANGFSLGIDWSELASRDYPRPSWIPSDTEFTDVYYVVRVFADGITVGASLVKVPDTPVNNAGVTIATANPLVVAEGGTNTYTVVLDSQPTADVTITPSGGGAKIALSPASHTITRNAWNTPVTFTVSAVSDTDAQDESFVINHQTASQDGNYASISVASVSVSVTDDDTVGVTVTGANPLVVAEGGTNTYTVVLDTQPAADVTITPASNDVGAATVSPASHTFTPQAWNTPRTFTVSGLADDDSADESVNISHQVNSQDGNYNNILVSSVVVSVSDTTPSQAQPEPAELEPPGEEEPEQQQTKDAPLKRTGTDDADDLEGGGGNDRLVGLRGDDVLRGLGGNDELRGGRGADTLVGGRGGDTLVGGRGDDELDGGRGADRLLSGNGDDTLTGGPGKDRFIFFSGETGDKIITDFGDGADLIVLKTEGDAAPWPSVSDIIAGVVAQGDRYLVYTLSPGLTVETDTPLRPEDIVTR